MLNARSIVSQSQGTVQRSARGHPAPFTSGPSARRTACRAQALNAHSAEAQADVVLNRRDLFLATAAAAATAALPLGAFAEGEYSTLIGYATPPTSYGGYGGNAAETPRYTFEYPTGWKQEVPNKVEKGTQGIDSRVVANRSKDIRAFVISLTRAGEDGARFKLTDLDSTLSSFAGADYDIQDAISGATSKTTQRREDGDDIFYEYDIESPDAHYLSSIAVKNGKVFALFVRSPTKSFRANEEKLRHIINTFRLL